MEEEFKDVIGYEGLYIISNVGNLFSTKNGRRVPKNKWIDKLGYYRIGLTKNGIKTNCLLHRVMMIAFVPNTNNYLEINHIDANKLNNSLCNLEWCSRLQNMQHAFKNGLMPDFKRSLNPQAKGVIDMNTGIYFDCLADVSDCFNITPHTLRKAMITKRGWWPHLSKRFKYF